MLNHLICGTYHPEEEDDEGFWSSSSTPRRSRRSRDSKNPYSARGLDKFSALVADLEEKRRKIYSEVGSQDISFVRFAFSHSNDCVPIVVKLRDKKQENIKYDINTAVPNSAQVVDDKFPVAAGAAADEFKQSGLGTKTNTEKKTRFSWKISVGDWRQPSYYLPTIIMVILLLLTVFGRSVVILCTCLGWYLVPVIKGGSSDVKRPTTKKIYLRRKSDKMVMSDINRSSSPKTNKVREVDVSSPGLHGHRKSW